MIFVFFFIQKHFFPVYGRHDRWKGQTSSRPSPHRNVTVYFSFLGSIEVASTRQQALTQPTDPEKKKKPISATRKTQKGNNGEWRGKKKRVFCVDRRRVGITTTLDYKC